MKTQDILVVLWALVPVVLPGTARGASGFAPNGDLIGFLVPAGVSVYAPERIPSRSEWAIVPMALLMLTVATVVLSRRVGRQVHRLQTRVAFARDVYFGGRL